MGVSLMLFMVDLSCCMVLFLFHTVELSYVLLLYIKYLIFTNLTGLPPLVLRRVLEILTYLATNHSAVANILFYFDPAIAQNSLHPNSLEMKTGKGKEKIVEEKDTVTCTERSIERDVPLILLLKLLSQPLFLRSVAHLEQVGC